MKENDYDIVEIIINTMPMQTELQERIKFYMEVHKNNCNEFIYQKYQRKTTVFNEVLRSLSADLGAEITRVITSRGY